MLICPAIYYRYNWGLWAKRGRRRGLKNGKLPRAESPRIGRDVFTRIFQNFHCVLPSIRPQVTMPLLSTIPEGFSSILCILYPSTTLRIKPRVSCTRPLVFQYRVVETGGWNWKKSRVSIAGRHWTRGRRWFLLFCVASIRGFPSWIVVGVCSAECVRNVMFSIIWLTLKCVVIILF